MPNPATISDITDRFRALTAAESTKALAYLDDAWWLLTGRLQHLEANMAAGTVSEGNVVRVVCAMVIRVLQNPEGLLEEEIDDYRRRRDALTSTGALMVSDAELADLTPGSTRRTNSVRLVAYGDS